MNNPYGVVHDDASRRWAAAERVPETVIAPQRSWCRNVLDDASRRWAAAEARARDVIAPQDHGSANVLDDASRRWAAAERVPETFFIARNFRPLALVRCAAYQRPLQRRHATLPSTQ